MCTERCPHILVVADLAGRAVLLVHPPQHFHLGCRCANCYRPLCQHLFIGGLALPLDSCFDLNLHIGALGDELVGLFVDPLLGRNSPLKLCQEPYLDVFQWPLVQMFFLARFFWGCPRLSFRFVVYHAVCRPCSFWWLSVESSTHYTRCRQGHVFPCWPSCCYWSSVCITWVVLASFCAVLMVQRSVLL